MDFNVGGRNLGNRDRRLLVIRHRIRCGERIDHSVCAIGSVVLLRQGIATSCLTLLVQHRSGPDCGYCCGGFPCRPYSGFGASSEHAYYRNSVRACSGALEAETETNKDDATDLAARTIPWIDQYQPVIVSVV